MASIVDLSVEDSGIATIWMRDEAGRNVFSDALIEGVVAALDRLEDEIKPHVAILRGLPDVFSGGAEKKALMDLSDGKVVVKDLILSENLIGTTFPVIAATEGHVNGTAALGRVPDFGLQVLKGGQRTHQQSRPPSAAQNEHPHQYQQAQEQQKNCHNDPTTPLLAPLSL